MQREREREGAAACLRSFPPSFLRAQTVCPDRPAAKTGGILIRRKNATRRRRRRRSDVHCSIHCSSLPSDFLHSFPPPASNFLFGSINSCPNFSGRKEGYTRSSRICLLRVQYLYLQNTIRPKSRTSMIRCLNVVLSSNFSMLLSILDLFY